MRVRALVVAATAAVLLAGCSAGQRETVESSADLPWTVIISSNANLGECLDDPAVDATTTAASSQLGGQAVVLVESAGEGEAERVADCIENLLGDADITIMRPAGS